MTEDKNSTTSLNTLNEVIQLLTLQDVPVYPELYNNIGVLHYGKGSYDSARTFFEKALDALKDSPEKSDIKITIDYNIARLEDASGNTELAFKLYNQILEKYPDYLDARIRTTYLALALNEADGADKVKALMDNHGNNLEVRALYGWYLRRIKKSPAKNLSEDIEQKHYKHSLVDYDKHDTYSLIGLGNLYLSIAREIRVNNSADAEKKEKTYFKAAELFDKALQIDSSNAYAAQGVAIILAETKRAETALPIFGKVRETLNDISIHINMGDCLVELKEYSKAIECYEIAQQRFGKENDAQLMTLLGRAWYARGMRERSLVALKQALKYTEKASELSPENAAFKFNVAFVKFQIASFVQKTAANLRTIEDIEAASNGLTEAIGLLKEVATAKYPPFPPSDLEQRSIMGQNTILKQLERALVEQKEYESKTQDKLEQGRKIREAERMKHEEEQRKKKEAEEARQRALDEEREQLQAQAREWTEQQIQEKIENEKLQEEEKESKKRNGTKEPRSRKKKDGEEKAAKRSRKRKGVKSTSDVESSDFESEPEPEGSPVNDDLFGDEEENSAKETDEEDATESKKRSASPEQVDREITKKRRVNQIEDDDEDEE